MRVDPYCRLLAAVHSKLPEKLEQAEAFSAATGDEPRHKGSYGKVASAVAVHYLICAFLYSYWTASTMSLLAAVRAGRRPAKTPIRRPERRAASAETFG